MYNDALNAVCPYYTMYPLDFPLQFLKRHARPGDWVMDPFCGRGTTNFAARLLGLPSIGVDSSPVAAALALAKICGATAGDVMSCARAILESSECAEDVPDGDFWTLAYHPRVLQQLCRFRENLLADCSTPSRILLRAIILGALHGPRPKGVPSYFSNQSPRTFAPKPRYAVKYWSERGMLPPEVDVLQVIRARAERYLAHSLPSVAGVVVEGDSRNAHTFADMPRSRLVVTSPPYFGMRTYLPDQWLRLWFLGGASIVSYRQSSGQLEHSGADHFASELAQVWKNAASHSSDDARLVIRFGGIHDRRADPMHVLKLSLSGSGWKIVTAHAIADSDSGRRQVRQFQAEPKKAIAEYDVYCHRN